MLEKYRTKTRQGIIFGLLIIFFGFAAKGSGYVGLGIILAGILLWARGWWLLAKGKGHQKVGGWLVLTNFLIMLFFLIQILWGKVNIIEYPFWGLFYLVILLVSSVSLITLLFLPDKYNKT